MKMNHNYKNMDESHKHISRRSQTPDNAFFMIPFEKKLNDKLLSGVRHKNSGFSGRSIMTRRGYKGFSGVVVCSISDLGVAYVDTYL